MHSWYIAGLDVGGRERRLAITSGRGQCVLRWPPGELIRLDVSGALHAVEVLAEASRPAPGGRA